MTSPYTCPACAGVIESHTNVVDNAEPKPGDLRDAYDAIAALVEHHSKAHSDCRGRGTPTEADVREAVAQAIEAACLLAAHHDHFDSSDSQPSCVVCRYCTSAAALARNGGKP